MVLPGRERADTEIEEERRRGEGDYESPANPGAVRVQIGAPLSRAAVDTLIAQPGNWDTALAAAGGTTDPHQLDQLETDLLALWQAGAAEPFEG